MIYHLSRLFILGLGVMTLMTLPACGKKGPLYLDKPLDDETKSSQTQQTESAKDKQNQK